MMRYTESHEWVSLSEDNIGTVGITDFAQKELGEIVFIECPKVGALLKAGQEACVLESTKAAADIYAPVSGKVIAVNEALRSAPSSLNKGAETSGWLYRIALFDLCEWDQLMTRDQYLQSIAGNGPSLGFSRT